MGDMDLHGVVSNNIVNNPKKGSAKMLCVKIINKEYGNCLSDIYRVTHNALEHDYNIDSKCS